ncbi:MAG: hypothetical protein JXB23_08145 [Candidatus Aminicenantes bacterium]|nr:hypothetical protein [Candidatus Aminicenantes bacterium]
MAAEKKTKRLYFDNPYQVEFKAKVIGHKTHLDKPALILDQTCFYPESGGQPADKGSLNGVEVVDVVEMDEQLLHVLRKEVTSDQVQGIIDWEIRFDHMQQHAGQHILSQSFYTLFNAETVSFHLGNATSTVEIDMREVKEEDVDKVERLSNEVVFQNEEICTYITPKDMIETVPLRKPPKKAGHIRVVQISDFDYSACGGTHPRRTGEIGLIKILKWERIRNNLRFEFVCGQRSLRDYAMRNRILRDIALRFTVGESELLNSTEKLLSEFKDQRKNVRDLQQNLLKYEAQELVQNAEGGFIKRIFSDKSPDMLRQLSLIIIKSGSFFVLFGTRFEGRARFMIARSEDLDLDLRELVSVVSPLIDGRGGGRPSLIEVSGAKTDALENALEKALEVIKSKLGKS